MHWHVQMPPDPIALTVLLVVVQSHHSDLEAVLGEIASGRNLPQPQGSEKTGAASEMMTDDDTGSPPSPGGSSAVNRPGSRSPTNDLAALNHEQPGAAAALALLKLHNPEPAGSSRTAVNLAWGEQLAEPTLLLAAGGSRDGVTVTQGGAGQQPNAPASSVQQAALAARLRATGVSDAFAAGFPTHNSSNSPAEAEAQQQVEGQQDEKPPQQQDALSLDDAIAATALLASVFKLGEQQQQLVISGLLGTGLFSAPALVKNVQQASGASTAEQKQQTEQLKHCGTLAERQECGSVNVSVQGTMQQATAAGVSGAAANHPAAAAPAVGAPANTRSLQDSMQAPAQQLQCQVSGPAGSASTGGACVAAEQVAQHQVQQDRSAVAAAGHEPMPATAMAFLAALLARQGAAAKPGLGCMP
jgi:hypothetical protein